MSPTVDALVLKALSIEKEQRFLNAREMQRALVDALARDRRKDSDVSAVVLGARTCLVRNVPAGRTCNRNNMPPNRRANRLTRFHSFMRLSCLASLGSRHFSRNARIS